MAAANRTPTSSYPSRIADIRQRPQRAQVAQLLIDTAEELAAGHDPTIIARRLANLARAINPSVP